MTKTLQACGVKHQGRNAFVVSEPSEIVRALVGLKCVRVLHYERRGRDVQLMVEQTDVVNGESLGRLVKVVGVLHFEAWLESLTPAPDGEPLAAIRKESSRQRVTSKRCVRCRASRGRAR